MTLSPAWLDELRARTLLSGVIAPSVKLIKAGREWKACCPFHNEKTPSFTVNDDKGFYHCFGCGAHGDAIRFLTDHRGLPFMDAVKELAGKAGIDVPAPDPRAQEKAERTASLTDVMASVQRWYADQLQGAGGGEARDYLKGRGIDAALAERFGIGFAPDGRTSLRNALASLGEDKLVETGMLIKPDDGGAAYDRFRGRLMIPIRDARSRVIGFGGRIMGSGEPKYLNSPDTPLFDKGRTLYNLDLAGPASRSAKRLIVVEGYMDVIGLARAGIDEVVAPNGTAVTEAQLERMWRLDPSPILCFDGDAAGQKAAIRAALRALPMIGPDRTFRFVELPAGQDPDDVVAAGGKAAFEALVEGAEPLDRRLWRYETAAAPLTTPEARAGLRQRLMDHASTIGDPELRRLYRDQWLGQFDAEVAPRREQRQPFQRGTFVRGKGFMPPPQPASQAARAIYGSGIDAPMARSLLVGFLYFPQALSDHAEQLAGLAMTDPRAGKARDALVDRAYSGQELDREALVPIFETLGVTGGSSSRNAMSFSFTRPDTAPDRACADLAAAVETLAASEEVERALLAATERFKKDMSDDAWDEQQRLIDTQRQLKERLASLAGTD
ncbi:MAG TPA: DNA primase [Sphingomicrobium sp.]|nr:DNA primase [Sphingomicrobium sp.]